MGSSEQPPSFPVFSHASTERPAVDVPPDEIGSVTKELPPGALPEPPDNRAGASPSQFDKLDGFGGDAYDWF